MARWTVFFALAFGSMGHAGELYTTISWSPDGKRFVYVAERAGGYELHVVNLRWKSMDSIVRRQEPIVSPAFSPDGVRVAYIRVPNELTGRPEVRVINNNGTDDRCVALGTNRRSLAEEASVSWVPSGGSVLIGGWLAAGTQGSPGLYVADIQGQSPKRLNPPDEEGFHPRCQPKGDGVLYLLRKGGPAALASMKLDGSERTVLADNIHHGTQPVAVTYAPAWSPDGQLYSFVEQRPNSPLTSVWVTGLRGRVPREVSPPWHQAGAPSWSGNSAQLCFYSRGGDSPACVWAANAGSLLGRPVLADGLFNVMPAWSYDCQWLAVRTFWLEDNTPLYGSVVRLVNIKGETITFTKEDAISLAAMRLRAVPDPATAKELRALVTKHGYREGGSDIWMLLAGYYAGKAAFREAGECWVRAGTTSDDAARKAQCRIAEADAWAQAGEDKKAIDLYCEIADKLAGGELEKARLRVDGLEKLHAIKVELLRRRSLDMMEQIAAEYERIGCMHQAIEWRCKLVEEYPEERDVAGPIGKLVADCEAAPLGTISWRAIDMALRALRNHNRPVPQKLLLFAAETQIRQGDGKRAMVNLVETIEAGNLTDPLKQRIAAALIDLGDLMRRDKDYTAAVACYSRSTSLWRPGLEARAQIGLGDAYRKQGRHEDAGRAYERALDGCSRPEAEQVVQSVSVAIQTEPANARAPYVRALAKAYRQSGMPDKATEIEGQAGQR